MSPNRREFLQLLAVAAAQGMPLSSGSAYAAARSRTLYDLGQTLGNVTLMHMTDCHAQLLPVYFREPDTNIGVGDARGRPPHLVGNALLNRFGIRPGSREAHAYTHLDYVDAARTYGKVGGFAHLATLVKHIREQRTGALLLDGGDTWQGSATALWSKGQDMVDAAKLLGVNIMTGHWEFTYGAARVQEIVAKDLKGHIEFLAQNIRTTDFEDPVFPGYTLREINGARVAIIGQAFPYTPIANPRHLVADWTFGIQEERLQRVVDEVRAKGAQAVVLLSHNGMDTDLKLASRVSGIDAILGGHTHDAMPQPVRVSNRNGVTLVGNAGSNGKFLGVLELDVREGAAKSVHYRLLPVFANLLDADPEMQKLIAKYRAPHETRLGEQLAVSEDLLFRRGNFNGSFDQLILDALLETQDAEIAFSPGFRWGTSILPGDPITFEDVMNMTAITYPHVTNTVITGEALKNLLEDICDNLFNPDPYYQQGGDMVRVGGLRYSCAPSEKIGNRISDLQLSGKPVNPEKRYKLTGWAPVTEGASGTPIWDVVARYLRDRRIVKTPTLNRPHIIGANHIPEKSAGN